MNDPTKILLKLAPLTPHHCVIKDTLSNHAWEVTCTECGWRSHGWTAQEHAIGATVHHAREERWVDEDGQRWVLEGNLE